MDALTVAGIVAAGCIVFMMLSVLRDGAERDAAAMPEGRRRTVSYTGRRATDLCPDPDCRKASRAHQRRTCGNLSATVGEWPVTPE
jgi:hypothetical protein